jgi:lipopolysaccharide/colanic/teichoic acid biosynthesis glycosyltransferase
MSNQITDQVTVQAPSLIQFAHFPDALKTDVQIVHEFFLQRERRFNRLALSPYYENWHRYFAWFGRRRVKAGLIIKRLVDVLGSLLLIVLFAPVLVALAVGVLRTSPGPIFYKSLRVGRSGTLFYMLKFRSMVADADMQRHMLRQQTEQQNGLFKLKDDPRVTAFGAMLRKYSLDELPQLLNVLKGEMSLVGPRPYAPDDARLFEDPYTIRFEATPGMTGLWQVSGRSNLDFTQACQLDYQYTMEWSLLNDLRILFKTVPAVFQKSGAF